MVIDKVYENVINMILKDFTYEEQEEVREAYKKYLRDCYEDSLYLSDDETELINHFTELENMKWSDKSKVIKQALILEDEWMDKIRDLSNIALEAATLKLIGKDSEIKLTKKEVVEYEENMKEYLTKVRDFNRQQAYGYVSEATLDFEFAVGLTDNMSLRVGRMR